MGPLDREVVDRRLVRLDRVLRRLEGDARRSLEEYLEDEDLQARVERRLQLAAHSSISSDSTRPFGTNTDSGLVRLRES